MPQRLLTSLVDDVKNSKLTLTFQKNVSLTLENAATYDTLREIRLGSKPYSGLNRLTQVNPRNERVWIVFYTAGPSFKGRKVDDEIVVVIETREDPGKKKSATKKAPSKAVKKQSAKPAASKKKAAKKGVKK